METVLPLAAPSWGPEEYQAINEVVDSGHFTMGSKVASFESAFAEFHGGGRATMVNSGSSANLIMLTACRFGPGAFLVPGDEVIVPAVSWSTTYYPVNQVGARLRFVDIDPDTLNISVDAVADAIGPRTRAVLAVNLLGNPADLPRLTQLCDEHGLVLLEDNCESLGARIEGQPTGTFGLASTCSTFFSHHISTMEGGVVLTKSREIYEAVHSLRAHGWTRGLAADNSVHPKSNDPWEDLFRFVLPGFNVRPLELEGAIGVEQLKRLPDFVEARRRNAALFASLLGDLDGVSIQKENGESSWFGFALVLDEAHAHRRRELVASLTAAGIESRPIVAGNFTKNPVMRHLDAVVPPTLPGADRVHDRGLFVGNHHFDVTTGLVRLAEVTADFLSQ